MQKHSELPFGHDVRNWLIVSNGRTVATIPHHDAQGMKAAALIVRAVNAHQSLVDAVEAAYEHLASGANQWPERHTQYGQSLLCQMRDAICAATGRDAQDVQDDFGNRHLLAKAKA